MNDYELPVHTCHDKCQNPICVAVRKAVAAEREACAQIVEKPWQGHFREVAAEIRARGKG